MTDGSKRAAEWRERDCELRRWEKRVELQQQKHRRQRIKQEGGHRLAAPTVFLLTPSYKHRVCSSCPRRGLDAGQINLQISPFGLPASPGAHTPPHRPIPLQPTADGAHDGATPWLLPPCQIISHKTNVDCMCVRERGEGAMTSPTPQPTPLAKKGVTAAGSGAAWNRQRTAPKACKQASMETH